MFVAVLIVFYEFWSEYRFANSRALSSSLADGLECFQIKANVNCNCCIRVWSALPFLWFFMVDQLWVTSCSFRLVGLGGLYFYFGGDPDITDNRRIWNGASCVALFSRVGGGIARADVGADLVEKLSRNRRSKKS